MSDMRTALLMIVLAGCTPVQSRHVNRIGAALTVASMACDWGGTRSAAAEGWSGYRIEAGFPARPIMGGAPSTGSVDVYFATSTAIVLALAQLIPERYRWMGYAAVVAGEANMAYVNLASTRGVCGVRL